MRAISVSCGVRAVMRISAAYPREPAARDRFSRNAPMDRRSSRLSGSTAGRRRDWSAQSVHSSGEITFTTQGWELWPLGAREARRRISAFSGGSISPAVTMFSVSRSDARLMPPHAEIRAVTPVSAMPAYIPCVMNFFLVVFILYRPPKK